MSDSLSANPLGSPLCTIDCYPYQGGSYSITGGQILQCTITKSLGSLDGVAEIILAPGGPNGQGFPSWAQIIGLNSLVVAAMSRAGHANVVFVGIVTAIQEDQVWETGGRPAVVRNTRIIAQDWTTWFMDRQWSALTWLAVTNGLLVGEAVTNGQAPEAGLAIQTLSYGEQNGNPAQIAWGWFSKLMGGTGGLLADTLIPYQGSQFSWPALTTSYFESYPGYAVFPASYYYVSETGSWISKFSAILQHPWYEILCGTAVPGTWSQALQGSTNASAGTLGTNIAGNTVYGNVGTLFTSLSMPQAAGAQAIIMGRLQPLPDLVISQSSQASQNLAGNSAYMIQPQAFMDYWNSLPVFTLDSGAGSFIESTVTLMLDSYFNTFVLNPTYIKALIGTNIQAQGGYPIIFSSAINVAGIHRYGFKSMNMDSYWFADPSLIAAQSIVADPNATQTLYNELIARMASYYTPLPEMRKADCIISLRPDINIGCRFRYSPFRGSQPYEFYITSYRHKYIFGGPSTTELSLDRGLPISCYDSAELVGGLLQGATEFVDGSPTPQSISASQGPPMQLVNTASPNLKAVLGSIANVYSGPQQQ